MQVYQWEDDLDLIHDCGLHLPELNEWPGEHTHQLNSARLYHRNGAFCSKPSAHHIVIVIDTADMQCLDYCLESYEVY